MHENEIQVRYRYISPDGIPSTLKFRFFRSARAAQDFLHTLDDPASRQSVGVTIAFRPTAPWAVCDRTELERLAFLEGGGR